MKPRWLLALLVWILPLAGWAQSQRHGGVFLNENGRQVPVIGAVVRLLGTSIATATDSTGQFWLSAQPPATHVVVSFVGLSTDTIAIRNPQHIHVVMRPHGVVGQEIELTHDRPGSFHDAISAESREVVTQKELYRAACCNLSESFETNPSVDVSFADAVTGARQIQLLGLSGIYTQITTELLPQPRGLMSLYGLGLVPGTWLQSLQITKGPGPVSSGFEAMAGHINVELKKPEENFTDLNLYVNSMGRTEANAEIGRKLTLKSGRTAGTALMVHGNWLRDSPDMNMDSFADVPRGRQLNLLNRWKIDLGRGWMMQAAAHWLYDNRQGGQLDGPADMPGAHHKETRTWRYHNSIWRGGGWAKLGWVDRERPYRSLGFQASVLDHRQETQFGLRPYSAREQTLWFNGIWQSVIGNTQHQYRAGISLLATTVDERTRFDIYNGADTSFRRREYVPGVWAEYTWQPSERLALVAGLRGDFHNYYGAFATPRLHFRYDLTEQTQLRLSAGMGRRTANILAENSTALGSSRLLTVLPTVGTGAYGLKQEVSTNVGGSLSHDFELNYRKGNLRADLFHTRFNNQVVADYDVSARRLLFYNLEGASFSTAFQIEGSYSLARFADVRLAWRQQEVATRYLTGWQLRPLTARQRAFATIGLKALKNKLTADYTVHWVGPQRLPTTRDNAPENQLPRFSPGYWQMSAQLAYKLLPSLSLYTGVENLNNFRQRQLVLSAAMPFDQQFDPGYVWGPVFGRMFYGGIRLNLK